MLDNRGNNYFINHSILWFCAAAISLLDILHFSVCDIISMLIFSIVRNLYGINCMKHWNIYTFKPDHGCICLGLRQRAHVCMLCFFNADLLLKFGFSGTTSSLRHFTKLGIYNIGNLFLNV